MNWKPIFFALTLFLTFIASAQQTEQNTHKHEMEHHFALKELDEFHEVLHPLVHDAFPKGDYDTIKDRLDDLLDHAKAIENVELPDTDPETEQFMKLSKKLVAQVEMLRDVAEAWEKEKFDAIFNDMHETFEELASMSMR